MDVVKCERTTDQEKVRFIRPWTRRQRTMPTTESRERYRDGIKRVGYEYNFILIRAHFHQATQGVSMHMKLSLIPTSA